MATGEIILSGRVEPRWRWWLARAAGAVGASTVARWALRGCDVVMRLRGRVVYRRSCSDLVDRVRTIVADRTRAAAAAGSGSAGGLGL